MNVHKSIQQLIFGLLVSTSLSSCVTGIIYTDVTEPLVTNMRNTSVGPVSTTLNTDAVSDPLTIVPLSIMWDSFCDW